MGIEDEIKAQRESILLRRQAEKTEALETTTTRRRALEAMQPEIAEYWSTLSRHRVRFSSSPRLGVGGIYSLGPFRFDAKGNFKEIDITGKVTDLDDRQVDFYFNSGILSEVEGQLAYRWEVDRDPTRYASAPLSDFLRTAVIQASATAGEKQQYPDNPQRRPNLSSWDLFYGSMIVVFSVAVGGLVGGIVAGVASNPLFAVIGVVIGAAIGIFQARRATEERIRLARRRR